jgi:hypothetical protein
MGLFQVDSTMYTIALTPGLINIAVSGIAEATKEAEALDGNYVKELPEWMFV